MTLLIAGLLLVMIACVTYLIVVRKELSLKDLSLQLLLTLLASYLGVLASLETSRHLAEENYRAVVIGQTRIALSKLQVVRSASAARAPDGHIERRIHMALPSLRRLADLEDAPRVLGLHAIDSLDRMNFYGDEHAANRLSGDALRSHAADLWRLLAMRLAETDGDKRFKRCKVSTEFRKCDSEIHAYLKEALHDPNAPSPTAER